MRFLYSALIFLASLASLLGFLLFPPVVVLAMAQRRGTTQAGHGIGKSGIGGRSRLHQQAHAAIEPEAFDLAPGLAPTHPQGMRQLRLAACDIGSATDATEQATAVLGATMGIPGLGGTRVCLARQNRIRSSAVAIFKAFAEPDPGLDLTLFGGQEVVAQGLGSILGNAIAVAMGVANLQ